MLNYRIDEGVEVSDSSPDGDRMGRSQPLVDLPTGTARNVM